MAETVTRAVFEAETRGVDKAAAALGGLSGAAAGAGKAVEDFTRTTNETATEIAGIERRVDGLQKRLAGAPAAWSRYEAAMRAANDGQKAGILTGEKYASTVREIQAELQRVVAPRLDMDAANSGLTALLGNTQKVTAATRAQAREMLQMAQAQQVADAEAARGRELMARETARYAAEIDDLRAKFDPAHASARRMGAELEDLARLEREGIAIHGGYEAALQGVIDKYDDTATAARKAADAQRAMIQQARRDQDNANAQTRFSSSASYGVAGLGSNWLSRQNPSTGSTAREAASVFEAEAKAVETLRAAIDPLAAAQAKLNTEVAEYQALAARGVITNDELALATSKANEGYQVLATKLGAVGTQAKLTQQQMLNLSRQANDVLTMGFMGMPLSMIVTSQLGQIYGALEENQRGVRGSIEAITNSVKNFASGLGPVGIALGALGVAAATFALVTRRDVEPLEDVIKGQAEAVRELRDAYGLAGDAAENYARRAPNAVRRRAEGTTDDSLARAEQEIRDRIVDQYAGSFNRLNEMRFDGAAELRAAFDDLFQSIEDGVPRFIEFQDQLALIPDAELPYFIRDAIKANIEWAASFIPLQQDIEGTEDLLNGTALAAQNYRKAMSDLSALAPDLRTNAERINAAFSEAMANSRSVWEDRAAMADRNRALAADTAGALDMLAQARRDLAAVGMGDDALAVAEINVQYDELEKQYRGNRGALLALAEARKLAIQAAGAESALTEEARRANYELDLRAVNARTAAEKASIESERVRIDLMAQGYTATEAAARATEAYTLAIAQSSAEWTKASESRQFAREDALANAQAQVDSFGMSAGAAQAYGQAIQQLTAYRRAAAEAGMPIDPAEEQAIRDAASAAGAYTDALARMNMERDQTAQLELLRGEARLVGLSENARSIAMAGLQAEADLRRQNLSTTDDQGQAYIRNAQHAAGMRAEIDRQTKAYETQQQFVENVLSTSLDALFNIGKAESWGDAVLGIFADIGRQFQELAKQNLMQALFGQNYTTGQLAPGQRSIAQPGFPAGFGSVPVAANQNVPAGGALNIGAVQALNTNLQRSSRSALDVARQFDGLNERADSAVLDSFMQASGNWRNLSAADTAWCAAFANAAIVEAGGRGTGSNLASSFMGWGQGTNAPQVGDIVVLKPQSAGASGHVGFVAGFGDGKVQVFGGNQSNAANTRSFGLDQVRGYRTGVGVGGAGIGGSFAMPQMAVPVYAPQMSSAAQQAMAQGWSGFGPVPGQAGRSTVGMFGQGGRMQQFMQSPIGQLGMQGIGAFGAGYSSGSTGGGALQGGLGAFLSSGFNPVAGVVGLVGGALGGLFGGRAKRRQEHQQKAQAWEQMAPQWSAFQDEVRTGTGATSGLRASQGAMVDQFGQFVQVGSAAWKNGSNNSSALYSSVASDLGEYFARTNAAFRQSFDATIESLSRGLGMESPFVQARDEIAEAGKGLLTFVDDARYVFGEGSAQMNQAAEASIAQLRAMVSGSTEMSEVAATVDALRGGASQLGSELLRLGASFDDATRAVDETVGVVMDRMRRDFVQGLEDSLHELTGAGHIVDFRQSIAGFDQMFADAAILGVDAARVHEVYTRQMQAMVNQAELTGGQFEHLLVVFPQLRGVVTEFSAAAEEAAQSIEDALNAAAQQGLEQARGLLERSYGAEVDRINEVIRARRDEISELERTKSAAEQFKLSIRTLLDDLLTDPNLSPLSAQDRLGEAERQYRETLAKAMAGDETARGDLASDSQRYLDEARSFWASSEQYGAIFSDVRKSLARAETTAGREITEAQRQIDRLETLIKADEASLTIMEEQYNALLKIDTSVIALADAMKQFAAARTVAEDAAAKAGASTGLSRSQQYLANNADVLSAVAGGTTFGLPSGSTLDAIAKAHFDKFGQFEGRKYAMGGLVTGPGSGTSDSIRAMLSNGEYVVPAARVPANLPALEAMRVGRPIMADNGSSQMAGEIRALREENSRLLRTLISTTGGGLADVKNSSDRNARAAEQASLAERRRANNRQAA